MQKLTSLALCLAVAWSAPALAQADRSGDVAAIVKDQPVLAAEAAKASGPAEAASLIRRVAQAKLGAVTDGEVVVALITMSDELGQADRYGEALRLGEHALALSTSAQLGPGLMFDSLTRTGSVRYMLDDYDGATRDLDAARRQAALIEPFDANSVANATANYAVTLDQSGRYREAEEALRQAIALRAKASEQRPASIAVAWLALAAVHKRMGRHDLSEQDYRTGLTLLETAEQTTGQTYASALHNYGVLMGETGRDEEAAALYRRAIESRPPDARHAPSMVNSYTSLAASLMGLDRLEEAELAIRDAERAAVDITKPSSSSINVLGARADLAARRGDHAAAERDAAAAAALTRQIVAPDSMRLSEALVTFASALRSNGKPDQARIAAEEAVAISAVYADRTPLKAIAQDVRAAVLASSDAGAEALAASRIAAEIQARRFAEEGGRTPAPLQPEERGIAARRIALIWDASRP